MELLSPAGTLEKLKYALAYGADAVYTAGKNFGLRAKAGNLTDAELREAVDYTHSLSKKLFVTLNIYAHNEDLEGLSGYLTFLQEIGVDAVIVSEPGIFSLVREIAPALDIHISTQANVTSWKSAEFWYKQGAKRVILARELTFNEIELIKQKNPELEIEIFVHGAMCISYSGRCLLSAFLNKRSANRGSCTQPCRWKYSLVEETRPGQYFDIEEDQKGTYIMNSKDLCLFDRLEEILKAGLDSIKIEGRMKSIYYVALVTRSYRMAIDALKQGNLPDQQLREDLDKVSHRIYSEAFFDSFDESDTQTYNSASYSRDYQYIGEILAQEGDLVKIASHHKFSLGETIDFVFPDHHADFSYIVREILDEEGNLIDFSKPNTYLSLRVDKKIPEFGLVRKKVVGVENGNFPME